MKPTVRVRGIYSTALTRLFKDLSFTIVEPSQKISERLTPLDSEQVYLRPVWITDRPDRQGVIVQGEPTQTKQVIEAMRTNFLDMVLRSRPVSPPKKPPKEERVPLQAFLEVASFEVEFPYIAKSILDQLRAKVAPTITDHHRFRIITTSEVDRAEEELLKFPDKRKAIGAHFRGLIQDNFRPGNIVRIEHVKPEGQVIQLIPGKIRDFEPNSTKVVIKREGLKAIGRYDGLGIIKEEGDYAITETQQGTWVVIHSYYSMTDELKGQFYNINTPCEFYPDRIRYVDLHIDVIRWPDGRVKVIDRELLDEAQKSGYISQALKEKAEQVVQELVDKLAQTL